MRTRLWSVGNWAVEDGIIRHVSDAVSAATGAEVLDLSDHLLLPGFVNAHCHLSLSALHEKIPQEERFTDWVRALLKANAEISQAERVRALRAGARALLESGVTALGDYASPLGLVDRIGEAALQAGGVS